MTARRPRTALLCFIVVAATAAIVLLLLVPAIDHGYLSRDRGAFRGLSGLIGLGLGLVIVVPVLAVVSARNGERGEILAGFLGTVAGTAVVIAVADRVMAPGEPWVRTIGFLWSGAVGVALPIGVTFLVVGGITYAVIRDRRRLREAPRRTAPGAQAGPPAEDLHGADLEAMGGSPQT